MNKTQWLKRFLSSGAAALALCVPGVAAAGFDVFLKLDGIAGESLDERHKGEIEIISFAWDVSPKTGDLTGRTAKVCAHDLAFVKNIDRASPLLISSAIGGTVIPTATLTVRKQGGMAVEFFVITMSSVLVSSVNHSVSASSSALVEQFTLNLTSATVTFRPQKADGSLDAPIVTTVTRTC